MVVILPIQFTDADGTKLSGNVVAINAWPGKLIQSVELFKNNTNLNITQPQQIKPYKIMIDELKKIPKNRLKLLEDLQYVDEEVTVVVIRSNTAATGKANLDKRIA